VCVCVCVCVCLGVIIGVILHRVCVWTCSGAMADIAHRLSSPWLDGPGC